MAAAAAAQVPQPPPAAPMATAAHHSGTHDPVTIARERHRQRFHQERAAFWDQCLAEVRAHPPLPGPLADMYLAVLAQPRPDSREELIAQCQRLEVLHSMLLSVSAGAAGGPDAPRPAFLRQRVPLPPRPAPRDEDEGDTEASPAAAPPSKPVPVVGNGGAADAFLSPFSSPDSEAASAAAAAAGDAAAYSGATPSSVPTSELLARPIYLRDVVHHDDDDDLASLTPSGLTPSDVASLVDSTGLASGRYRAPASETPSSVLYGTPSVSSSYLHRPPRPTTAAAAAATAYRAPPRWLSTVGGRGVLTPLSAASTDDLASSLDDEDDADRTVGLLAERYRRLPPRPAHFSTPAPAGASKRPPLARATVPPSAAPAPAPAPAPRAAPTPSFLRPLDDTSSTSSNPGRVLSDELRRYLYPGDSASVSSVSSGETLYADSLSRSRSRYRHIVSALESSYR